MYWESFLFLMAIAMHGSYGACPNVEMIDKDEGLAPMNGPLRSRFRCDSEKIDAATMTSDRKTFFFKDDFYWRLIGSDVAPGYPRLISNDWDGLPGQLDAALTWKDGRTFFFKGSKYWSFHGRKMDYGYPKNISEGFCGIPNDIDAVFLWKEKNLPYFVKGDKYWRFDGGEAVTPVLNFYPLAMKSWVNMQHIPNYADAALQWENGRTYFIKNGFYYKAAEDGDKGDGPIPLHGNWGLRCADLRRRLP